MRRKAQRSRSRWFCVFLLTLIFTVLVSCGESVASDDENDGKTIESADLIIDSEGMTIKPIYKENVSEGLKFTSNDDGTCYVYSVGACADTDIIIPINSPAGDTVTGIGYRAFSDCTNLTSINIPDNVTYIYQYAFSGCTSLTSINIPDNVTNIYQYAFSGCTSLTSINIPDNVTYIGDYAFDGCKSLTNINIPDNVTSISQNAFYDTAYYNDDANWTNGVLYIGNHLLKAKANVSGTCEIREGTKLVIDSAFKDCTSLTSIAIPDSVTSIGDSAFKGCTSLTSITIPDSIIIIENRAFSGCTSITNAIIGDGVTSISSYGFYNCSSLKSIVIPGSVTSIGDKAFYGCTSVEKVYYGGKVDDWQYKGVLAAATRYYYSEIQPTEEGNWWHYDENGNVIEW